MNDEQRVIQLSDEQLATRLQNGDTTALAQLVERHHRPLLGYLYHSLGGDHMLAEDLVQEAFLKMMRSIYAYQTTRPFKPWLYAIATNLVRDHYKRADTRHTLAMPEEPDYIDDADQPEAILMDADAVHEVSRYLMDLPAHQREVLILRYYHELSLADIAETLSIPVGTVKSRLSLGIRQLKTAMQETVK